MSALFSDLTARLDWPMMRVLTRHCPRAGRRLRILIAALILEAIAAGAAMALVLPVLRDWFVGAVGWSPALWAMLAGLGLWAIAYAGLMRLGFRIAFEVGHEMLVALAGHLNRLPIGWFTPRRGAQLSALTGPGLMDVLVVPAHLLRPIISALFTPLTILLVLAVADPRLALAILMTLPAMIWIERRLSNRAQTTDAAVRQTNEDVLNRCAEFARAQPALRLRQMQHPEARSGLQDALDAQRQSARAQMHALASSMVSFALVVQVGFSLSILTVVYLAVGGDVDPALLIALLILAVRFYEPLTVAADLSGALKSAENALRELGDVITVQQQPEPARPVVLPSPDAFDGPALSVRNLSFGFDPVRPILRNLSFDIPRDQTTAIVGPSGSGKSTLLHLLARFHDGDSGDIRMFGEDLRQLGTDAVLGQVAFVFQDVFLFDDSLLANIRHGNPDASQYRLDQAAEIARVSDIAARLPDGMNSRAGHCGTLLSRGEAQRVALARMLARDAPVCLLDEATSSLDAFNEAAVTGAISDLARRRTLVVVTHQMHTIRRADQILFLEGGRIVERGSHAALMQADGRYAAFCRQSRDAAAWNPRQFRSREDGSHARISADYHTASRHWRTT